MNPLVVSLLPRPPHPARDGAAIRNYHLLRALSGEFRVRALSLMHPDANELPWEFPPGVDGSVIPISGSLARKMGLFARSIVGEPISAANYRSRDLDNELATIVAGERPSWVVAHSYLLAPAALRPGLPVWVDFHNVDSLIWQRISQTARSLIVRLGTAWQYPLVKRLEGSIFAHADGYSSVSEVDAEIMRRRAPDRIPLVVPNGVDLERYTPRAEPSPEPVLLFVGDLRWQPNAEGVSWFARSVWPLLRERVPESRVEILGRGASDDLIRLADDRFVFLGDPDDTRTAWQRAALGIVPLLAGGGTRLKILEAAAMAVPVVSTSVGAEGLSFDPEREITVRDDPQDWVVAVARLLEDASVRKRIGESARARVEERYDWRIIGQAFANELRDRALVRQT